LSHIETFLIIEKHDNSRQNKLLFYAGLSEVFSNFIYNFMYIGNMTIYGFCDKKWQTYQPYVKIMTYILSKL